MRTVLRTWRSLLAATSTAVFALVVATTGLVMSETAASGSLPTVPQVPVAIGAAKWLTSQLTPGGYVAGATPGSANLSETVNTLLALAAANVNLTLARSGLGYMEANADAYIAANGSDGPGQLSLLILTAHALGADPAKFGGTDLVTRLLATEQSGGPNTGRFGTDAQVGAFNSGPYDQGLALAALKAVETTAPPASISWLQQAQCPNGGWTAPNPATNPCNGDPAKGNGPDTNTTALALQGLTAQGALTSSISASSLSFLKNGQNSDGGWAYDPNAPDNQQTSDPDSTALVMQALLAAGQPPDGAQFQVGGHSPTSTLLSFEVTSGPDTGAFFTPFGSPTTGDLFATFQAVPALMGLSFPFGPFGPSGTSYWMVASDGGIFTFGAAGFFGSMGGKPLNKPIVGIAPTRDGGGYWEVASDGGIFSFGDAAFHGSMGGKPLNRPVVGIAPASGGSGYWEVASDGGIFSFGDAPFHGSMGAKPLNQPVVGIAPTPGGGGYWEVASDGGVFSFGDAPFHGSMGGKPLNKPIVGITPTRDGGGYWMVASDGGVFSFGDASFLGSMGGKPLNAPVVGIAPTPDGGGYWMVASDGGVFPFGDADFFGSMGGKPLNTPIVGVAANMS
jgi:hypothetical protein